MIGTYASAALICAASLLVGRAILAARGRESWSLARARGRIRGDDRRRRAAASGCPGGGTTATLAGRARCVLGLAPALRLPYRLAAPWLRRGAAGRGRAGARRSRSRSRSAAAGACSASASTTTSGCTSPGASGCAAASGRSPTPAIRSARTGSRSPPRSSPASALGQAFIGELHRDHDPHRADRAGGAARAWEPARRTLAAVLVAVPYLAASYFAQAAFKETAEALFVLAFAIALPGDPAAARRAAGAAAGAGPARASSWPGSSSPTASPASPGRSRSRRSGASPCPRCGARWRRGPCARCLAPSGDAGLDRRPRRRRRCCSPSSGRSGSPSGFGKVAGSNTYGPVSPVEALGVWPAANYRLDAAGGAPLAGLAGGDRRCSRSRSRHRLVGAARRAGGADRARRLRAALRRLAARSAATTRGPRR